MLPLRVVLDTNVVVSAMLKPTGLERVSLVFALTVPARLYVSPEILEEYQRVLHKPQLRLSRSHISEVMSLIKSRTVVVRPAQRVQVTPDADDNKFLECADEARADYLVTGNKRRAAGTRGSIPKVLWNQPRVIIADCTPERKRQCFLRQAMRTSAPNYQ